MTNKAFTDFSADTIAAYKEIQDILVQARADQKIANKDLASRAGLTAGAVSNLLRQSVSKMPVSSIRKVAAVLGVEEKIDPMIRKAVGLRLRDKRNASGQSVRTVAAAIGVRHQRLSEVERGVAKDADLYGTYGRAFQKRGKALSI